MRIGEFAKRHNITHDTVRHYIDVGLLIPRKDGHHYRFDDSHNQDIARIIELKNLDFSLIEIQKILNLNRLAGNNSKEYKSYYSRVLEEKKRYVIECQDRYEEIEFILNKKIEDLVTSEGKIENKLGIRIDSLDILYCPKCSKSLNINDGNIENNMIINGRVLCDCGYRAYIEDGIYIGNSCGENLDKDKGLPSKVDFMEGSSTEFINFFYDGMSELKKKIKSDVEEAKYILELENCSGTFLMQYIEDLDEESTYIVVNNDKSRLRKLKNNLQLNSQHEKFIFICEEFNGLPIKNNSIDLIIDHWMTKDYAFKENKFLLDDLSRIVKVGGQLVGAYPYVTSVNTNTYVEELKDKGFFNSKFISGKFKDLGFVEGSITEIGPLIEEEPYNKIIKDRKVYLNIYSCKKTV